MIPIATRFFQTVIDSSHIVDSLGSCLVFINQHIGKLVQSLSELHYEIDYTID